VAHHVKKLLSLFKRRERLLVAAIMGDTIRVTLLAVDSGEKIIEVRRTASSPCDPGDIPQITETMRRLLRGFGKLVRHRIIVSLDPALATTIHSSVILMRDQPKDPIDEADFDNRIAQGIWRLFDRERGKAASKMDVGDLDILMTDVKVKQVKLDGHRVVNPLGFKAKSVEIHYSMTFSPRLFVEALRKVVSPSQLLFMAEGGVMMADVLARLEEHRELLLLEFFPSSTHLVLVHGSATTWIERIAWGTTNFVTTLSDAFAVSADVAEKIFNLYLLRQASPSVLRRIELLLKQEFSTFAEHLREPVIRYNLSTLYLFAFARLPEFIFSSSTFRLALRRRVRILPVTEELTRDRLGFSLAWNRALKQEFIFPELAAFLEFYFLPHDDKMNKIAQRHARWLIR